MPACTCDVTILLFKKLLSALYQKYLTDTVVQWIVHVRMHIGLVQKKILKSYSPLYKKNTSGMPIIDIHKST